MSFAPPAPDWDALKERLFSQNQFAIKLGLDNMREALRLERLSRVSHRVVLIAGTNGKGTTASMLSSILTEHGLRVGLYTSPHLIDFNERFRIDGVPAVRELVRERASDILVRYADPPEESGTPRLTYFELTTLIACSLFEWAEVDVAVYEVGLGGRLDATNAMEPNLSVITTLGFDHQRYLGDTIQQIAREKAGIMRQGIAVVCGRQEHDGAADALTIAASSVGAELVDSEAGQGDFSVAVLEAISRRAPVQRGHARTASAAARLLLGEDLSDDALARGLDAARWPGRFETKSVTREGRALELFIDGAHNMDGVRAFNAWLAPHRPEHILFGAMSDKPLSDMVSALRETHDVPITGVLIQNARAASAEQLTGALGPGGAIARLSAALDALPSSVSRVAVCGSLYLVGELYSELGLTAESLLTRSRDESQVR